MDASSNSIDFRTPALGQIVLYQEGDGPPRAALVANVYQGGRVVDLVVLFDGDPASPEVRTAWALGHSITRARTGIPHRSLDPALVRHWIEAPADERLQSIMRWGQAEIDELRNLGAGLELRLRQLERDLAHGLEMGDGLERRLRELEPLVQARQA